MPLHLLHGCTADWVRNRQSCRNLVPEARLREFLDSQPIKYQSISDDKEPLHVLTIDDGTAAAAQACEIARAAGHEVTLFVNPYHVATGAPYFFTLLDAAIDGHTIPCIEFLDASYDLRNVRSLRRFRLAAKGFLCTLPYERSVFEMRAIAERLGAAPLCLDPHAEMLTVERLIHLHDIGVSIENHGWQHDEISHLNDGDFQEHVTKSSEWLRETLGVKATHYAVPFGTTFVNEARRHSIPGVVWLAHSSMPEGRVGMGHWNRTEITPMLQGAE